MAGRRNKGAKPARKRKTRRMPGRTTRAGRASGVERLMLGIGKAAKEAARQLATAPAEAKNQGEALVHSTERSLKDYGDKVTAEEKGAIETAITDLKGVLEGEDADVIKEKTGVLAEARRREHNGRNGVPR